MRFVYCCMLLLCMSRAMSQTKVPEFGTFLTEEKNLQVCEFDPEAEAVIIFDQGFTTHNDDRNLITKRRIRLKILKPKGIEQANIEIPYYSKDNFEDIYGIKAIVCNVSPSGAEQIKELASSAIFHSRVNERYSVAKFALPDVRTGSIIEYEYTVQAKNYNGLNDWKFQTGLPTMLSSYDLEVIPSLEFAYQVYKSPVLPIEVKNDKNSGKIYFEMKNIAALRNEPFMDAPKEYRQRVEFQLSGYQGSFGGRTKFMTTWFELGKELLSYPEFGGQLNKNVSGAEELIKEAKAISDPYQRMLKIYRYVHANIFADTRTFWALKGIKEAWTKKLGSSGDVNLLLINLLRSADLEVQPMLVSDRQYGKVKEGYPFLDQFNNVLARVTVAGKTYVLDAASSYTPPHLIPIAVVNTKGFVVDRKKGGIVSLDETKTDRNRLVVAASIDKEGLISGAVTVRSYDYAKIRRVASLNKSKDKLLADYFTNAHPGIKTDSFTVLNADNDSLPLEQKFNFQIPVNSSGEYKLLNLNMFTGLQSNPFISDIRFTNVDFAVNQSQELLEMISLPPGLEPETLPKDFRLITPDNGITCARFITYNNNTLNVLFRIEFNRSVFDAGEYPTLKEFYKKMVNTLNEPIILRNKN